MFYEFHNYKAKNINVIDLENMLDEVIDMYLETKGADIKNIVKAFERQCICVSKIKDDDFRDMQRKEAIKRLEILQQNYSINSNILKEFRENERIYCSQDKLKATNGIITLLSNNKEYVNAVKKVEMEWDIFVYHCVLTHKDNEDILTMFYVSDTEEEWEEDKEYLLEGETNVYVYNLNNDEQTQFEAVQINKKDGSLKKYSNT